MNREIATGGASVYPLTGDVTSNAGSAPVTVTGIQSIPVAASFPADQDVLTYDLASNNFVLQPPNQQVELETNGVVNSTQSLLNLQGSASVTIVESGGTVTFTSSGGGGSVTRSATTTNSNGSFWTWSDGLIEAWGSITLASSGSEQNGGTITFPTVFATSVQSIQLDIIGLPNSSSIDSASIQVQSLTGSGAVINLQCSVPTGGGGTTFNQAVTVMWRAIGS